MSTVLLIEDSPTQAHQFGAMLEGSGFAVEHAARLEDGLRRLARGGIDIVLLDLSLPDSSGIDTFLAARTAAPGVPIVVLTGLDDEVIAATALQRGAQDYLVKGEVNQDWLCRAIRYAQVRPKLRSESGEGTKTGAKRGGVLQWERDDNITVVRVTAKRLLGAAELERFEDELTRLIQAGCRKMVIGFAEVEYMSNGAIGALLNVLKRMRTSGGMLILCQLSANVHESLKARQLHRLFSIDDEMETALATLRDA
jgi:anti-anti-sigma factor